jgi:hypothetical protein
MATGLIIGTALQGTATHSQTSLMWAGYDAGLGVSPRKLWMFMVEYVIILFPAINVISATPLYVIATVDNMCGFFNLSRRVKLLLKVITCLIPAILAFFTHRLELFV